jgi:translation initiation factor 1A
MPKNKGKGGKNRRRGKNDHVFKRELIFKEDGQEYAQVIRMLGNGRLEAHCFDGTRRLATIRGKMRKKVWINVDDVILVALRDFQDSKSDVILKYNPDEVRALKSHGEIPEHIRVADADSTEDAHSNIHFENIENVAEESDEDSDSSDSIDDI